MSEFCILTDSSCDLDAEMVKKLGVRVIPLGIHAEGKDYLNYPDNRDISPAEYYNMLRAGISASTSAPSVATFSDAMEEILNEGKDMLYLGFSSALSATYNTGAIAAEELTAKYPDRKIYTVDTLCASLGQGLLVHFAAAEQKKGRTIDEVKAAVESSRLNLCHWFTVDDLNHLHRGGRVSKSTAIIGGALNIKPIMHVDNEGRLIKTGVARGRKSSIKALLEKMQETATETDTVFISHGDCLQDAESLAAMIRERFKVSEIYINYVGPVIGTHSGPGTLALFFTGKQR